MKTAQNEMKNPWGHQGLFRGMPRVRSQEGKFNEPLTPTILLMRPPQAAALSDVWK